MSEEIIEEMFKNILKIEDKATYFKRITQIEHEALNVISVFKEKAVYAFLNCTDLKVVKLKDNFNYDDQGFSGKYQIFFDSFDPYYDSKPALFNGHNVQTKELQADLCHLLQFADFSFEKKTSLTYKTNEKPKIIHKEILNDMMNDLSKNAEYKKELIDCFESLNHLDHKKDARNFIDKFIELNSYINHLQNQKKMILQLAITDIFYDHQLKFQYMNPYGEKMNYHVEILSGELGEKTYLMMNDYYMNNKSIKKNIRKQLAEYDEIFGSKDELLKKLIITSYLDNKDNILLQENNRTTVGNLNEKISTMFKSFGMKEDYATGLNNYLFQLLILLKNNDKIVNEIELDKISHQSTSVSKRKI